MSDETKKTAVERFIEQLEEKGDLRETPSIRNIQLNIDTTEYLDLKRQAREMEKERMIKLIQFVVSEKELVDYSSVSNDTANYYLDKFNQGDNK